MEEALQLQLMLGGSQAEETLDEVAVVEEAILVTGSTIVETALWVENRHLRVPSTTTRATSPS